MRIDTITRDPLAMSDAIRAGHEMAALSAATVAERRGADTGRRHVPLGQRHARR